MIMENLKDDKDAQAMLNDLSYSIKDLFLRTTDTAAEVNMDYRRFSTVFLVALFTASSLLAKASGMSRDKFITFAKFAYDINDPEVKP